MYMSKPSKFQLQTVFLCLHMLIYSKKQKGDHHCTIYFLLSRAGLTFTFSWDIKTKIKKKNLIYKFFSQSAHLAEHWGHWRPWLSLPCLPQASPELDPDPGPHFSPSGPSAPAPVMLRQGQPPAHHNPVMLSRGPHKTRPTRGLMS